MGLNMKYLLWQLKNLTHYLGFHGGSGVESSHLPTNADSIPDLRRSHMLAATKPWGPQLLNLCSRAWEQQLLKPVCPRACVLQ